MALVVADKLTPGHRPLQLHQGLFCWDAAFYRDIADYGYGGVAREGLRFFPLLPLAARVVGLGQDVGVGMLVVANAAALASGILLYRLVVAELGDRQVAARATWLLALLPPAAVLVLGYAESLLLVLSIAAFLGYRQGRWWSAALCGVLAGLARPVGVALMVPAAIEGLRGWRRCGLQGRLARIAAVAAPAVGTGLYLAWVGHTYGDWKLPIKLQDTKELRGGYEFPVTRVAHAVRGLLGGARLGDGLHVPWIALFLVLLVVAFRRLPVSYGAYAAVVLVVALSAESIGSFERYGLSAFPLLIAAALVTADPRVDRLTLVACGAGLAGYTALIFLGAFVP